MKLFSFIIVYILLIKFKKYVSESNCFRTCQTCNEGSNDIDNECISCIEGTYMLLNSKNCYYQFELPKCYLDASIEMFNYCSSSCYECLVNENNCISCPRKYLINEQNQCIDTCPENEYIYILDGKEKCQGNKEGNKDTFNCELKITICSNISLNEKDFECPKEYPIFINNNECTNEFNENNNNLIKHSKSNNIIRTQWLNRMNQIGSVGCWYMSMDLNSNNDLIIETTAYEQNENVRERFFYGIKNNGRPFFYNKEQNQFLFHKKINFNSNYFKYESQLKRIRIVNEEKDYFLSISYSDCLIELADLDNDIISTIPQMEVFGYQFWASTLFSILELKNEENNYLFCFTATYNNKIYIILQKIQFLKSNLSEIGSYSKMNYNTQKNEIIAYDSRSFICIEISSLNIIECFYLNETGYYSIAIFNEKTLELIKIFLLDDIPINIEKYKFWDKFYSCIFLKDEISVFGYILDNNPNIINIKIKNIIFKYSKYKLEDYFILDKKIEVNKDKDELIYDFYFCSDLKKINDNKFFLISFGYYSFDLYIIIFDIYNFHDSNLIMRNYNIPLKLYNLRGFNYILGVNFNGFIGFGLTAYPYDRWEIKQTFTILSYINSTDPSILNLELNSILNLSNYINSELIENNLFGVYLYGVKILNFPKNDEIGVYFFSQNKSSLIYETEILNPDDIINFVFDYDNLKRGEKIYTIEIAGVVQESSYSQFNNYCKIRYIGNHTYEEFYQPRILLGKTAFINFTIPAILNGITENSCKDKCNLCYGYICVKCNNDYILIEDYNICSNKLPYDNYFYDKISKFYRKCHNNCKTCSNGPIYYDNTLIIKDSNCDTCKDDYYKIIETNNCLHKDDTVIAYYLDIEKGLFLNCYKNCMTCRKYKDNTTYLNCLTCDDKSIFYKKSTNCLDCALRDKYVNYYQYDCIDFIPDGYYLLNEGERTIEPCYITCKHCNETGDTNNHKCTKCADAYPYIFNNGQKCLDDCSRYNLYLDSDNNICYEDCKYNINEAKKYNYKNKCISKDDIPKNYELNEDTNTFVSKCPKYEFNNQCYDICPDGTKLDESNNKKCKCNKLYYLKGEEQICINSKICTSEYPYINRGSYECRNWAVTYKGQILLACPDGTCISQVNENLGTCVDNPDEYKNFGGLCFDNFVIILDNLEKLDNNDNIVINEKNGIYINIYENGIDINSLKTQEKNKNLTFIQLGECAGKLKSFYNLNSEEKLYIISIDYLSKYSNKPTNDYAFEIYIENGTQLENISICDNISRNDITLNDRIIDIFPYNVSFCPNHCNLSYVEIGSKRIQCLCSLYSITQNEPSFSNVYEGNIEDNDNFIAYILDNLNYKIFGCTKVIINSKLDNFLKNIGFLFGFTAIIFNIINCFIFYLYFLTRIKIQTFKAYLKNKYLKLSLIKEKKTFRNTEINNISSNQIINVKSKNYKNRNKNEKNKKGKKIVVKKKKIIDTPRVSLPKEITKLDLNDIINESHKNNDKEIDKDKFNDLPYSQALNLDKRNIFLIFISIFKLKIELISILFYPEDFSNYSLDLSIYTLHLLFNFFMNALLYTDNVVSKKYHNNGALGFLTSLFLSLISNIISNICIWIIKKITSYSYYLAFMIKEAHNKVLYLIAFNKLYRLIKLKILLFYCLSFFLSTCCIYYLTIFCIIYNKSQISLLNNYIMGELESLVKSLLISIIISLIRFFGLKYKLKQIYRTSVYLDAQF